MRRRVRAGLCLPLLALVWAFLAALVWTLASADAQGEPAVQRLTSIAAVRALSRAEAAKGLPAEVTGVVTYANEGEQDLFIQSGNAWIYVQQNGQYAIRPGDLVTVTGKTSASYSNQIEAQTIRVLGESTLPQPAVLEYADAVQRENDCRYVTMEGVVRAASFQTTQGSSLYLLRLEAGGKMMDVVVANYPGFSAERLLDATVRMTGALGGTFDSTNDRIVNLRLNVSSGAQVQVVQPADSETGAHHTMPMAALLGSNEILKNGHRVFTTGIATLYDPGDRLVVQDGDASLLVRTRQMDPIAIGQRVEVTGFLTVVDGVAGLDPGQFVPAAGGSPVRPREASFNDLMSGLYANKLVTIEGEVVSQTRESHVDTVIIKSGDGVFPAVFRNRGSGPDPFPTYDPGTQIRATGVCMVQLRGFWGAVEGVQIHLRSPQDIAIVKAATWWTPSHLFLVLSGLLGITLVALAWGFRMRWRLLVHEKVQRQKSEQEAARLATLARLEQQRSHILELINSFQPLSIVLPAIQAYADELWTGTIGYIHVLVNRKLILMTRSHLSQQRIARLEDVDPTSSSEACAEAVRSHGLVGPNPARNVWSRPILSSRGEILGTMTFEGDAVRPMILNREAFEFGCNLAAIAVDNRRLYEDVLHRSEHDQLTGLANRALVQRRLEEAVELAEIKQGYAALLYLDLDNFKAVNDSYTHRIGDAFLVEVAQRFKACIRDCDTLGRMGGDEFVAILMDVPEPGIAVSIADRLVHAMDEPFRIEGHIIHGAVSVGLAFYPSSSDSAEGIMQYADHAMYAAKRGGGNRANSSAPEAMAVGEV
ncbi:MAG TPA: diguanylate cyclase [Acidobacteriaceae bacterium]